MRWWDEDRRFRGRLTRWRKRKKGKIFISYPGHVKQGLPQKPFHQAHINTIHLPSPLKTRSFDNVPAFLPSFFLQSSSSSCRCLTVPSVQRKKHGRLKVFFPPLFTHSLLTSIYSSVHGVISLFLFLSLCSSSCQYYYELSHPTYAGMS